MASLRRSLFPEIWHTPTAIPCTKKKQKQKQKQNKTKQKQKKKAMSSLTSTLWWYAFTNSSKPNEPVIFKCSTYSTSYYNF